MSRSRFRAILSRSGLVVAAFLGLMLVCAAAEGRVSPVLFVSFGLLLSAAVNALCGAVRPRSTEQTAPGSASRPAFAPPTPNHPRGKRAA